MRDVVLFVVLLINVLSLVAMVAGILMHSGRGGGLSDMFGGGAGAALGSSAAERNLTRITFAFALVWILSVIALSFLLVRASDRCRRLLCHLTQPFPVVFRDTDARIGRFPTARDSLGGPPRRSGGMADALA